MSVMLNEFLTAPDVIRSVLAENKKGVDRNCERV